MKVGVNQAVQQGVKRLAALPQQLLDCLPQDHYAAHKVDPHLDQQAQLRQLARQRRVANDQAFFRDHRGELRSGQSWAGRGRDGQLHLMPHASTAADTMMAIDRTTRVENASGKYLLGEIEGGGQAVAETVKGVADLTSAAVHPQRTFDTLQKNHAGAALLNFSRNSERITLQASSESFQAFCDAQHNPRQGGRATGNLGVNILLAAAPLPLPGRLSRIEGVERVAEAIEHAPKAPPNPGPYPMKIWRYHPSHTRPTGMVGGKPGGIMEALEPRNARKFRAQLRQVESADLMAEKGYQIDHCPQVNPPGMRNPDFKLEGHLVEHYSPTSPTVDDVYNGMVKKVVEKQQAQRLVVNLDDCPLTIREIQKELLSKPIDGLEEVITIRAGEIEHIYP